MYGISIRYTVCINRDNTNQYLARASQTYQVVTTLSYSKLFHYTTFDEEEEQQ